MIFLLSLILILQITILTMSVANSVKTTNGQPSSLKQNKEDLEKIQHLVESIKELAEGIDNYTLPQQSQDESCYYVDRPFMELAYSKNGTWLAVTIPYNFYEDTCIIQKTMMYHVAYMAFSLWDACSSLCGNQICFAITADALNEAKLCVQDKSSTFRPWRVSNLEDVVEVL